MTPGQNVKRYLCGTLNATSGRIEYVGGERRQSVVPVHAGAMLKAYPNAPVINVVLDNFRIHSSKQVQGWTKEKGHRIRLPFLPPYCPDDNKIERKWRDLHPSVTCNHCCKTIDELMAEVERWLKHRNNESRRTQRRMSHSVLLFHLDFVGRSVCVPPAPNAPMLVSPVVSLNP